MKTERIKNVKLTDVGFRLIKVAIPETDEPPSFNYRPFNGSEGGFKK